VRPAIFARFSFRPDSFTADGSFTVVLRNSGRSEHYFVIEGVDDPDDPDVLMALSGEVQQRDFDLEPGTYTFYCSVSGHRAEGMVGEIEVSDAG
jgi:plastocyanin